LQLEKSADGFYYYLRTDMPTPELGQSTCEEACGRLQVTMRLALLKTDANYQAAMASLQALTTSEYFGICRA